MRQIEGRQPRWELFHQVHMISRTVKRMPGCSSLAAAETAPGAAGWHVLNSHLPWMLGPLLQIVRCLHLLYTPQVSSIQDLTWLSKYLRSNGTSVYVDVCMAHSCV